MSFHDEMVAQVLRTAQKHLGHIWYTEDYQLNLIGVRTPEVLANKFDDDFYIVCYVGGVPYVKFLPCTTDPGSYWLKNPSRVEGTAILVPGQYVDVYAIDKHNGKYDALCQRNGKVRVYRDGNRDEKLDTDESTITEGMFGINLHKAGEDSTAVEKWSAGCQVIKRKADFEGQLMRLAYKHKEHHGNKFTYTLLTQHDVQQHLVGVV